MSKSSILVFACLIALAVPSICFAAVPVEPVPEPATGLLMLVGAAGVAGYRKLRKPRS